MPDPTLPTPAPPPPPGLPVLSLFGCNNVDRCLWRETQVIDAMLDCTNRDSKHPTRGGQAMFGPIYIDHDVAASVLALPIARQPVTIVRGVATSIVTSFNGVSFWHRSHVGQEVGELAPSFANRNTSASIIRIGGNIRIVAPTDHVTPTGIFWSSLLAVRPASVAVVASATLCAATDQMAGSDDPLFPAITFASVENSAAVASAMNIKNEQSGEPNTDFISEFSHAWSIPRGAFRRERKLH